MRNETRGTLELTLAMVLSGTLGVFVVESGASPFEVVFFRCLFGAVALGLYSLARGFFTGHGFTARSFGLAVLAGVFIVFNWVFLFEAYAATSISLATVVYHTQPFFLVLLSALFLRERIPAGKLGWLAVAFAGLVLVSGVRPGDTASLAGLGYALAAAVLYALATFVTKRITGVRPHLIALVQVTAGVPLLLPFTDLGAVSGLGAGWVWLAGLGLIHTGLMYVLMYAAYAKLPTPKIAVLAFTYPAVAMGVDWAVYGHHIGLLQALGVPLIVLASLRVTLGKVTPARAAAPAPRTGARAPEAASPVATRAA
ncbi:DMT family transporter [Streptomyces sp. NRRL F-5727]|uniref:DMT family transporter n=1 Tax=Streptomyces sp. NRRL F-5727 TaxID=1463871 RepID=UPI0004C976CE|nr:DMT family transporter [Streptomyces sp. NRRL F-5727]